MFGIFISLLSCCKVCPSAGSVCHWALWYGSPFLPPGMRSFTTIKVSTSTIFSIMNEQDIILDKRMTNGRRILYLLQQNSNIFVTPQDQSTAFCRINQCLSSVIFKKVKHSFEANMRFYGLSSPRYMVRYESWGQYTSGLDYRKPGFNCYIITRSMTNE